MKKSARLFPWLLVLGFVLSGAPASWAQSDPVKEIRDINAKRGQAFAKGDLDAWMADVADNIVFIPARQGFRIEGKAGMRAWAAVLFQNYPARNNQAHQSTFRVFQNGTLVISNGYVEQMWLDRNGNISQLRFRGTAVWAKIDGRWQLVEVHNSVMPASQ